MQLFSKELLRGTERIAVLGFLLVGNKIEISIGLFLNRRTVENTVDLADEQVGRTTVEYQVVDIHQQMDTAFSLHDLKAIERCTLDIERAHVLLFVGCQRLITHLRDRHIHSDTIR